MGRATDSIGVRQSHGMRFTIWNLLILSTIVAVWSVGFKYSLPFIALIATVYIVVLGSAKFHFTRDRSPETSKADDG